MEYTTTLADKRPIVITIGNFDGIHLGHQYLLHELKYLADELKATPVMVTFSPHTVMVLRPDVHFQCLTTIDERLALAERYGGISESIIVHFTPEVIAMSAESFMDELCTHFSVRGLVVGANFSLGRNRMGNIEFLEEYAQRHELTVRSIALTQAADARISSTRIRSLVSEGAIQEANELLGHPLLMQGEVVHGDERGRLLGFPTANIRPEAYKLLPANGVYVVLVRIIRAVNNTSEINTTIYPGVANIGVRPTFNEKERLLEVHLLDVQLNLYGATLAVEFLEYLRSEQRFSGIEALKEQITHDVQKARQILTNFNYRRVSH
jgi:riboflavin kinase / FMN adenylyltransferase